MTEPTVAAAMAERTAQRLRFYRDCVARVSRGESLPAADADELPRVMGALRIPDHAFRRDVRAMAGADTAAGYRRLELTWNHPHLFDEPAAWVDRHVRAIVARRGGRPWPR